ncbi:MAG: hypothetical protein HQ537_02040 [Parcubacteria group bacterium]|nr:hypothetical protein [Parcubacteria group bacterium]
MEEKIQNKYQESVEEKNEEVVEKPVEAEPNKEVPMQDRDPDPEGVGKEIVSAPTTSSSSTQVQQQVKQLKGLDHENQVKALCNLALQKGLDFAIEIAKNLDNAYILDELHDSLVDELRKKLIEKGELKQL